MCGLVGLVSPDPQDHARLERMTDTLAHRGPDSSGFYREKATGLGHRRLAILDLSPAGNQPMTNEDKNLWLVCNGEIYNYQELTLRLKARGHTFISNCDCETILHLYEEKGRDFLSDINGMFALVLWDQQRGRLLAAVDRFGKKPLYYAYKHGRLALASEMKSLFHLPWISKDLDLVAVDRYLMYRYVPAPMTICQEVKKLEPASYLVFEDGRLTLGQYWLPRRNPLPGGQQGIDDFHDLLTDAVRLRLQSDVPLGLYLSGGVDSALVAGIMRPEVKGERLVSYTLSVDYKYDERQRAQKIADYLSMEFNPVSVEPTDFSLMPTIAYHLDEPFGDLLSIPAYILAKEAKKQLTVVLTGDGADEITAGYFHQKVMNYWRMGRTLFTAPQANRLLAAGINAFPASFLDRWFDYPDHLRQREKLKLVQTFSRCQEFTTFYEGVTSCFTPQDKQTLYAPLMAMAVNDNPLHLEIKSDWEKTTDFSFFSRLAIIDLKYWIPFSVIYRLDKLNMAHAVETRSPYLDYRLVEMALNLPDEAKIGRQGNKLVLRRLLKKYYSPELIASGKQAFYMPVTTQNRSRFFEWVSQLLTEKSVKKRGLFVWPYIKRLLDDYPQESMLVNRQLVALAMLELWSRVFVDNEKSGINDYA